MDEESISSVLESAYRHLEELAEQSAPDKLIVKSRFFGLVDDLRTGRIRPSLDEEKTFDFSELVETYAYMIVEDVVTRYSFESKALRNKMKEYEEACSGIAGILMREFA